MKSMLSISIAILLMASCKKSNNDLPVPPKVDIPKVKTFEISNTSGVINSVTIEYDNAGRYSKGVYKDGHSMKYTYTTNTVTAESFTSGGVSESKVTYVLNGDGLAIKYYYNAYPDVITHYTYNSAKKLLSEIIENNDDTTYRVYHTYDAAGNLVADSTINGSILTKTKTDYYTDKISTTENPNSGINYFGLPNTNCVKQSSIKISSSTYIHSEFDVPETDTKGRITKSVYKSQGQTYTRLYTYY
ncbi:MAG: hypothetical protein ABI204_04665 [Ginsengibacter sp.]